MTLLFYDVKVLETSEVKLSIQLVFYDFQNLFVEVSSSVPRSSFSLPFVPGLEHFRSPRDGTEKRFPCMK